MASRAYRRVAGVGHGVRASGPVRAPRTAETRRADGTPDRADRARRHVTAQRWPAPAPIDLKMPSELRISGHERDDHRPAGRQRSPRRRARSPGPRRPCAPRRGAVAFAVAEQEEQDVVGADAEQHHDQDHLDRAVGLEVEQLVRARPIRPDRHLRDQADRQERERPRGSTLRKITDHQQQDQRERREPDDRLGLRRRHPASRAPGRPAPVSARPRRSLPSTAAWASSRSASAASIASGSYGAIPAIRSVSADLDGMSRTARRPLPLVAGALSVR